MNFVEDFLATADLAEAPVLLREFHPAASVLLTPRYVDSRHVVMVLLDRSGNARLIAKVVRRPGDQSTLAEEARVLGALARLDRSAIRAPRLLAFAQHRNHWMLLETASPGRTLTHKLARRRPAHYWRIVDAWLGGLPATGATTATDHWFERQVVVPFSLARDVLGPGTPDHRLISATQRVLSSLVGAALPAPIEHGDLSHPNLLVSREDELSVIDWESGRLAGLAGGDAAVFLAFLSFAVHRAHGVEAEAACYGRDFLADGGVGRRWLAEYLERACIDTRWLDLVLLATWSRYAVQVFPRMAVARASTCPGAADFATRIFQNGRALRLWRMTAERVVG